MPDDGTDAQLVRVPARTVHEKPPALSFEEAAAAHRRMEQAEQFGKVVLGVG